MNVAVAETIQYLVKGEGDLYRTLTVACWEALRGLKAHRQQTQRMRLVPAHAAQTQTCNPSKLTAHVSTVVDGIKNQQYHVSERYTCPPKQRCSCDFIPSSFKNYLSLLPFAGFSLINT